jgi:glutamate-ammonia-ligase adenylyltransferase
MGVMTEAFPPSTERLGAAGCRDPQQARRNLERLAGASHQSAVASMLPLLLERLGNLSDPDMALNNLERYAEAVLDRGFLLSLFRDSPKSLDLALTIFGNSQYLSDILLRFPRDFQWLLEPGLLRRAKTAPELVEDARALLGGVKGSERAWSALRRFKMRETLRIGLQDLLGNLDLTGVTHQLSLVAEVALQTAYEICWSDLMRRHGLPRCASPSGEGVCSFCVVGMGKLGGGELNFSSDIDLMFVYEADGETEGVEAPSGTHIGRVSNHEFFTRLGEQLIKAISEVTPEGRVFRVDMRLRPEGRAGALVHSLRGYELYYESWGQTWERMALIKARPVAGDRGLGRAFVALIEPFVYRQSLDYSGIAEIRAIKDRIDANLALDGEQFRHVKLGYGGIREIEFIAQTFQLLYGASDPWVRESNTLRALQRLADLGHLTSDDHATLARAYTFLRTVEHRLQILHHLQTHTLPSDREELGKLARRLGYSPNRSPDPASDLQRDYQRHVEAVRQIYDQVLREPLAEEEHAASGPLARFFRGDGGDAEVREALADARCSDLDRAVRSLLVLRDGPPFRHHWVRHRRVLADVAPTLMLGLKEAPDPDLGLLHLERFIVAIGSGTAFFDLFARAPLALVHLIRIFGSSEFLAEILIRHPELLDLLLLPDQAALSRPRRLAEEAWHAILAAPPGSARLDTLRRLKRGEELRIGIRDVLGKADLDEVSAGLTRLAEASVEAAYRLAREELTAQYGRPSDGGFVVLGLGKCGAGELGYGSDLDLAFAYATEGRTRDGVAVIDHAEYFGRLADRICKILTTITREGMAYRVDIRLRPGGSMGRVAQSFAAFEGHLAKTAELWERQAYLKARPIAGDLAVAGPFMESLRHVIYRRTPEESLAVEIATMRRRMELELTKETSGQLHVKLGAGGIADIEFLAQLLQLAHGVDLPALRVGGTAKVLDAAGQAGFLSEQEVTRLRDAHRFLRHVQNRLRIATDRDTSSLPGEPARLDRVARRIGYGAGDGSSPGEQLLADYRRHTEQVRRIYEATFERYGRGRLATRAE